MRPNTVSTSGQVVIGARSTIVPSPGTMRPELTKPMNAMKSPMPTTIAFFSSSGIARMIDSRSPRRTKSVIARPSMTMSPIASG